MLSTLPQNASPPLVPRLLALALPLAGQNILAYSLSLISVGFIGHLGKYELSVAVLATSLYNLTGNSVIQGMAGGMETLCGQVCWWWCLLVVTLSNTPLLVL